MKGALSRKHFVQNGSQGKNIRPGISGLASDLLGRHVSHGAENRAHGSFPCGFEGCAFVQNAVRLDELGETEIENFHAAIAGYKNIVWFEIAMNDAFVVRCRESLGDLRAVLHCKAQREGAAGEFLPQRVAFETLRNQKWRAVMLANVVDGKDVGVVERGNGAGLSLEASQALCVPRKRFGQDLDGYIAPQTRVTRTIHLTHATCAEWGNDFVRPEFRARGKGHRARNYSPA